MFRQVFRRFLSNVKYTKSHEWIQALEGGKYRIGITNHAQDALGEIVHVEVPAVGKKFAENTGVVTVESVKTTADVYTPTVGQLVALNTEVIQNPSLINEKPESSWIFEISSDKEPANLISREEYQKFLKEQEKH